MQRKRQNFLQGRLYEVEPVNTIQAAHEPRIEEYRRSGRTITRAVVTTAGKSVESTVRLICKQTADVQCDYDKSWLMAKTAPPPSVLRGEVRIADLFAGAGGFSIGIDEAARALGLHVSHVFASEIEPAYLETYCDNFQPKVASSSPIQELVDGKLGARMTRSERALARQIAHIDLAVGGPPCQGHSDLNNHTRRNDPKNELYFRMARFAEVYSPEHLIIENVPGVQHDKSRVFDRTVSALLQLGYDVASDSVELELLGVPQRRHRRLIVASMSGRVSGDFLRKVVLRHQRGLRTVKWAIEDLEDLSTGLPIDMHTQLSAVSKARIDWMFDNGVHDLPDALRPDCHRTKTHTYKSVYGRLFWDQPSWTITTGYQVMGQGRFVHPTRRRVITAHEAARLQFIPDFFRFRASSRKCYGKMIGNAVPPRLAYAVTLELLR